MLEHLSTAPTVPAPLGKYAHAVTAPAGGRTIYISGQVGMEEHEQRARPDLDVQTTLAFENIERVLAACGSSPQSLVKLTTFLKEGPVDGFLSARDRVYARWFPDGTYPAHSLAKVSALVRPDLLVEIEAVAHIPKAS